MRLRAWTDKTVELQLLDDDYECLQPELEQLTTQYGIAIFIGSNPSFASTFASAFAQAHAKLDLIIQMSLSPFQAKAKNGCKQVAP